MRYLLFALVLFPQFAFSQYQECCFHLEKGSNTLERRIGEEYRENAIFDLNIRTDISGFSISGAATLDNETNSYVRVILRDKYNYDYLLYELYPLLADTKTSEFTDMAIETMALDQVTPKCIIIELKNASLRLDSYSFNTAIGSVQINQKIEEIQSQYIVDQLNRNLKRRNMTWRAGVTSISEKSYEEKKAMFGGKVPELHGFEHYKDGIFTLPEENCQSMESVNNRTSNQFANCWDWRNRHGRNWMTSVKDQGNCGACWIFSTLGTIEACTNLYFNRTLNCDLSEEEVLSCSNNAGCEGGTSPDTAFCYAINHGIINDSCFRYTESVEDCSLKCPNPSEIITIDNYQKIDMFYADEDSLKRLLFKQPLLLSLFRWGHGVVLTGYKTIEGNDIVYNNPYFPINVPDSLVGKTAWLIKNSWGDNWGNGGYAYIICRSKLDYTYRVVGGIHSINYENSDIIIEDRDGDGLYFWGIGPKPSHCPSWVPDTPDGDDSNINLGVMDDYGNLDSLSAGITINTSLTYSSNSSTSYRFGIVSGGTLTITGTTTLTGSGHIRVCEGGTLIVDGGTINDADITLVPGCTVILRNNGIINMASGKNFEAPEGAVVQIDQGVINNS